MKTILYRPHRLSSNLLLILGVLAVLGFAGMMYSGSSPAGYRYMKPSTILFLLAGLGWLIGMCVPIKPVKNDDQT